MGNSAQLKAAGREGDGGCERTVNFTRQLHFILLTELFDRHKNEFGLDGLEAVLRRCARAPLAEMESALLAAAHAFSPPTDDQTLILIRRTA